MSEKLNQKIPWPEYALRIAQVASMRSADPWVKVGCCLLRNDNTVAGTGYNGFPAGIEEDWENRDKRRLRVIHAEANALKYVRPNECYLAASTLLPCNDCLKQLASYNIKKIVYGEIYQRDQTTLDLAEDFGIELVQLKIDF